MTARHRLLVVDDEERILQLLLAYLEDYDEFEARGAHSGEEALDDLEREPADLCVVDMRLPGMDGEAFILAALERGRCGRFVLHSGSVDLRPSEALRRAGVTDRDVFLKPSDMDDLLERVREVLGPTEG